MSAAVAQTKSLPWGERQTLSESLILHFIPGIVITAVFAIVGRLGVQLGWPASLALLITWVIAGIPILLGILFFQGQRWNGRLSLDGILLYREPMSFHQYAWVVPLLLVWTAASSTLLFFAGDSIRQLLFAWWPDWLNLSALAQDPTRYSSSVLWTVVALSAILNIAVPITEELYFRSFLLPRLSHWGGAAPLISTLLFSLYHFWLPWDNLGRIAALLPVVYAVRWKHNVYISIWTHCLLNSIGTVGLVFVVMNQSG